MTLEHFDSILDIRTIKASRVLILDSQGNVAALVQEYSPDCFYFATCQDRAELAMRLRELGIQRDVTTLQPAANILPK